MTQEITIHRSIKHKHIVEFHTFFEDKDYIYIVLELCSKRVSLEFNISFSDHLVTTNYLNAVTDGNA